LFKFHQFLKIPIKFYSISNPKTSLIINSNYILNLKSSNKEIYCLLNSLQIHILFEIFRVQKGIFWTVSNSSRLKILIQSEMALFIGLAPFFFFFHPGPPLPFFLLRPMGERPVPVPHLVPLHSRDVLPAPTVAGRWSPVAHPPPHSAPARPHPLHSTRGRQPNWTPLLLLFTARIYKMCRLSPSFTFPRRASTLHITSSHKPLHPPSTSCLDPLGGQTWPGPWTP
jgi:hypothetical protein